ncbi:endonuclease/exonuclease/phosphatase family protein [Flavivirga spongiicola]|uniref:Endonuclease/exonuclease/phosphatase family protein n=1 Tax=Flavivirga spongiicola TaxID=421621 RepID=A0ABU7XNA2_9FLAO|nr:endonuclease/exonuclease/phosphatase family protein [Flavivirga sp. MEBiC05379]MDO5981587.1 endonuclease/exonuclease/phosphatase family protein [Flavivirga sp. MEBiC05379]
MSDLKITTLNLYNLQIAGERLYRNNVMSQADFDGKIKWTSEILKQIDSDIIGFQELWHPDALTAAFKAAGLENDYHFATRLTAGSINVALAVKKPLEISDIKWVKKVPEELKLIKSKSSMANAPDYEISVDIGEFSRAVLNATVKVSDEVNIEVFVGHLKSQVPMRIDDEDYFSDAIRPHQSAIGSALSSIRRVSEAAGLRILANQVMKGTDTPTIIMGDLNEGQNSVMAAIVSGDPGYRLITNSRSGSRSDAGLYSVATLQELRSLRDVYYTYIHDGFRQSLDHIFVSEQFYDHSRNRLWSFKETRIINDHIDDSDNKTFGSDHGVVVSKFDWNPAD